TGYTGTAGAETIFTLTLNPTTGAFTYTQQGTLDHPDTTDADDTIPLQFGFTATDGDGDAVDGVITINVKDDGPIARNDVNEYETIDGGATGNVITGENGGAGAADTASQDDATLVTQVSFGGTVVDVPAGGATINGAHGVLTIQQDGSYSYVLNATSPTSGTVVVTEHEFSETLGFPTLTEGQQISGSTVNNLGVKAGDLTVGSNGSGTVTFVSEGAGYNNTLGMYTVAADGTLQAATILIKNGNAVTAGSTAGFTANAGEKLGFFIVADGATANSNYAGIDFSTGTVSFVYGYGTAQERPANVNDDGGDVSLVYTKNGVETVLNGDIYHTTDRGGSENLNADGTVRVVSGLANTGDDNTLRIGFEDLPALGDKDYEDIIFDITYTGSTIVPKACPEDTFTYVITDGDGDTSTATLTLDGACPPVDVTVKIPNIDEIIDAVNPANKVDGVLVKEDGSVFVEVEANYVGGNGNETMTLTLTGVRPGWVLTGTGWTETSPGTYTLVLPQGERAYDGGFTVAPPANTDGDMTGLQITATVAGPDANDDDSSSESFAVITDAVIDTPTLTVGNANANEGQTVALNIATDIGGDRDGSEAITKVTISGLPTGASLNKGTEVGGVWTLAKSDLAGLTITVPNGAEGTYTLQVTTYAEEVNLSGIEADLSDNQTTLTKDITLTVRDGDQPILGTPVVKTVDETNLASGNLVVGHNVSANFGADTPGTFNANNGFFSSTTLTSGGVAVVVAQSGNGYVGTANGATVFTLTLNQNTGAFVYTQQGTFDHPVKGTSAAAHNDSITLEFGFNARDVDGDSVNGVITINVLDDGLTARNDVNEYETVDGGA
ncbi:MAG: DUF4114 domain-containing protein, partial [Alphaproteobacteria bacterium]|nr:DUF4114 domain-containing protein [Alphaproteobacteria bacterium]